MTKKDYIAFANKFKELLAPYQNNGVYEGGLDRDDHYLYMGLERSIVAVSEVFAAENPRFNRDKFLKACNHSMLDL